jgi:hypothetical protein
MCVHYMISSPPGLVRMMMGMLVRMLMKTVITLVIKLVKMLEKVFFILRATATTSEGRMELVKY